MSEPTRWSSGDAPEGASELLRSARKPRPMSPEQRARSSARIDRLAALPVAAGVWLWWKGVAIAAVSVATVVVAVRVAPSFVSASPSAPAAQVTAASTATAAAPSAAAASVASEAPAIPSIAPPVAASVEKIASPAGPAIARSAPSREAERPIETAPVVSAAPEASAAPPAPPEDSLAREAALLEEARGLLGRNPAEALAKLDSHAATFPRGKLGLERELMALDALRRLGRNADARARGEALAARTRGTIYEERVKKLLEQIH